VLTRDNRLDALTVKVERRNGVETPTAEAAGHDLAASIKNTIGVSVRVEAVEPDGVERSTGKMRRIVDLRQRG
jgi:phenylacetate-CoA ligase